jgi:ATP-dependent protease ClpP protease subunit
MEVKLIRVYSTPEKILFIHLLELIESQDAEDIKQLNNLFITQKQYQKKFPTIMLLIDSPGGGIEASLSIYNNIKNLSSLVKTVGIAQRAPSGGSIILQGCTLRLASASSEDIIIHPAFVRLAVPKLESGIEKGLELLTFLSAEKMSEAKEFFLGSLPEIRDAIKFQKEFEYILKERTKLSHYQIEEIMSSSTATKFSLKEAKDVGLIDEISENL